MKLLRALAFLPFTLPLAAQAQLGELRCDDRGRMEDTLKASEGERVGYGLRDPETMLEVWITPRDGSWFMVQSYANGTACIVAMGDHWENITRPVDPA